ncbi:hypothetical protein [Haemophilus haemolyticus]|jgi:hypothetical protein|uniref:hypothetical protein n=1 Tax=Haemophilus haemolyticus TaxID=726 RepID=UPI0011277B2A|nr:hypothetical protein [Haemophilus haemolyticus]TPH03966.1 hypothetical protein EUX51_03205 [Haemophilus haemolyticus]DAM61686.1 MAG TPA: hypothetical protein [Caudoviricetes sp.]
MIPIISSFLIILSFSIGGFLGFLAGNGSLDIKFDLAAWFSAFSTLLGSLATIGALYVAKRGMNTWKEQHALNKEEKLLLAVNQLHIDSYNLISMSKDNKLEHREIDSFLFNNLIMAVMSIKIYYRIYQSVVSEANNEVFRKLDSLQYILTGIRNDLLKEKSENKTLHINKQKIDTCRIKIQEIEELIINITNKFSNGSS